MAEIIDDKSVPESPQKKEAAESTDEKMAAKPAEPVTQGQFWILPESPQKKEAAESANEKKAAKPAEPVTQGQFWIGIGVTILTTLITVSIGWRQTKLTVESSLEETLAQIAADRKENGQVHASALLKDLSIAIHEVTQSLGSYASMIFEIELCMLAPKSVPEKCLNRKFAFDPLGAQNAWAKLDSEVKAASPFLTTEEVTLLGKFKAIKQSHQEQLTPMLPPQSAKDANLIRKTIDKTVQDMIAAHDSLEAAVSDRARTG